MRIIVGSTALHHFGVSRREPKDLDFWVSYKAFILHDVSTTKGDVKTLPTEIMELIPTKDCFATPDAVYTIKCSHLGWDIKWWKHAHDIMHLKRQGCKIIPELYWALYDYWQIVHKDKSFLNLNQSKKDFFDDYVNYVVDHDKLHEIVSSPEKPMYTKVLQDNKEVLISYVKFLQMPFTDQVKLFREEIQVITLERFLIPNNCKRGKYAAYLMALKKTITNLTKNWATLFIVDNLEKFYRMDGTVWYYNYLKSTGKELNMHSTIRKVQDLAEKMGVGNDDVESVLFFDDPCGEEAEKFKQAIIDQFGFEQIEHEGGEGEGDYAMTVISLDGDLFKTEYSYASYDGYYIDELWDWNEVQAVKKEITLYE